MLLLYKKFTKMTMPQSNFNRPLLLTSICAAFLLVFITACDDDFAQWEFESYEVIGPLLSTKAELENITDFFEVSHTSRLAIDDLGFEAKTYDEVPPAQWEGPIVIDNFSISDHFSRVQADVLEFGLNVDNQFPIPIGEGTELVFFEAGTENEIHEFVLEEDIPPNESSTVQITFEDLVFYGDVDFAVRNIQTPGSDEETTFTHSDYIEFDFAYFFLDMHSATLNENQDYRVRDTTDFNPQSDATEIEDGEAEEVSGDLLIYIENRFPVDMDLQLIFLDENDNVKDSLFKDKRLDIEPAETDTETGELRSNVVKQLTVGISENQWNNIRRSSRVMVSLGVNSNHLDEPARILSDESYLELQLVADLIINPN